jgi:myosin heavy subunit
MAAKKSSDDGGGLNLDSLMDALTNVVAVLILALLLVNLDVTKRIVEFTEGLQPVTPEELEQSKQELQKIEQELDRAKDVAEEEPPTDEVLEAEKRNIALLEKQIEEQQQSNEEKLRSVEELRAKEVELREQRDTAKEKTLALQEEIKRLEALLDTTPQLEPIPPTVVTIPDSRPLPKNARQYFAMVRGNRIHFIDPHTTVETAEKEVESRRKDLMLDRVRRDGRPAILYDQQATAKALQELDFQPREGQTINVSAVPHSSRITLEIVPDLKNGGTTLEELSQPKNPFVDAVRKITSDQRAVLIYLVAPDAFATYLAAREISDRLKVPAGWEVDTSPNRRVALDNIEVKPTAPPPPPAPKKPEVGPPKIERKLD